MALIEDIHAPRKPGWRNTAAGGRPRPGSPAAKPPVVRRGGTFDIKRPSQSTRRRPVDHVAARPPIEGTKRARLQPQPITAETSLQPVAKRKWRLSKYVLQNSAIGILAIAMAYSSLVGQIFIAIYAIACLLLRLKSAYTFGVALILLIGIPFFQLIGQTGVSQNCAIYAYEMLVVGTLQAIVESFRNKSDA